MLFLAFVSCKNEDQTIFEFDLSNSYRIESSGESFGTPNAYESQSTNRFHLVLSDAEIGNTLTQPCCGGPWDYLSPPSTEVQISFVKGKSELNSGVYKYARDAEDNDFYITLTNHMRFDVNNILTSYNTVATGFVSDETIRIYNAQLEIVLNPLTVSVNYLIETDGKKKIVGSFSGLLKNYRYNICESDCD